ncbi:Conserved oligomeric Golgi complex subunit 1 [Nymphon striatum]|nr:Conserved oligomeric Golgi complex subunit 1 [Nymphon striatum]
MSPTVSDSTESEDVSKTSIMGTDALFENYTIEEIQEIEKKTKMEIEKKKEELRQMVGERYRDLIEAADTIQAMRNSANCITGCIKNMVILCENLPNQIIKPQVEQNYNDKFHMYEIGAQIKLLLDIPKEMWSYIDQNDYLAATKLYLFARHIHSTLLLLPNHGLSIQKNFPVVSRQWAAISHFRPSLLEGCHNMLKKTGQSEQEMGEHLVALMLLEELTPRQVFNQFLLARTKSLQDMFSIDKESLGVKTQICDVIGMILDTVYLVFALFYHNLDGQISDKKMNLLCEILNNTTSKKYEGPLKLMNSDSPVMKYLPQSVIDFRPTSAIFDANVTEKDIEVTSHDWIETVVKDVLKGFEKILSYVNSIRSLSSIRYSIFKLLLENNRDRNWNNVCHPIFKKSINIWKEFVHPVFISRIKAIIHCHLDDTNTYVVQMLKKSLDCVSKVDYDLSTFIWTKQVADGVDRKGWLNSGNKPLSECGQLAMKANGFMPVIQKLCHGLDSRLKVLLEDMNFFVSVEDNNENEDAITFQISEEMSTFFNCHADNVYISGFMQEQTILCLTRVLVIQLFASSFPFLPNPVISSGNSDSFEQPVWYEMKAKMKSESVDGFRSWSNNVTNDLIHKFRESSEKDGFSINHQPNINGIVIFGSAGEFDIIVLGVELWSEIEIQEENEDGLLMKSKIKVPSQISRNLMGVLIELCTILSQVGGHVLNKVIVKEAVVSLCQMIFKEYENQFETSIKQTRAIQMLFDIRFIIMLLMQKEDRIPQELIDKIENQIDPFDLDVFYPHIHTNLKRCIQGSMVLLGLIIPNEKITLYSGSRTSSSHDQHNVLPLTTGHNSFSLLPISETLHTKSNATNSQINRLSLKNSNKDDRARSASPSPTRGTIHSSSSGMGQKSQSFYDRMTAMSSSWFGQ